MFCVAYFFTAGKTQASKGVTFGIRHENLRLESRFSDAHSVCLTLLSDNGHKLSYENLLAVYIAFQEALEVVSFIDKLLLPYLLSPIGFCICISFIM